MEEPGMTLIKGLCLTMHTEEVIKIPIVQMILRQKV